ncbi:MAG: GntR family transcriptional regulator [Victivallaceae bacterium]|nr:GntR family transcriptional regulator [Victivallaceae bacterium]
MVIKLDSSLLARNSKTPLYLQLYSVLKHYVAAPDVRRHGALPGEWELCRIFNVSRNTVSQALSMLAEEKLVRRIRHRGTVLVASMERYDPRNYREKTLALVFPVSLYWRVLLESLEAEVKAQGYSLEIDLYSWLDLADEMDAVARAKANCAGIILYPDGQGRDREFVQTLSESHFPFVLLDIFFEELNSSVVCANVFLGGYQLGKYLAERGCRRIASVIWNHTQNPAKQRLDGFRQALAESGIEWDESLCVVLNDQPSDARRCRELLERKPDGVFCNFFSATLMNVMREMKLFSLPVAQFDLPPNGWSQFDIITAELPQKEMGKAVVRLLCEKIINPDAAEKQIQIAPKLARLTSEVKPEIPGEEANMNPAFI